MEQLIGSIFGWLLDLMAQHIGTAAANLLQFFLLLATSACEGFWDTTPIIQILDLVSWTCGVMWLVGLLMALFDLSESYAEHGNINLYHHMRGLVIGLAYAVAAPQFCKYLMQFASALISSIDLGAVATGDGLQSSIQHYVGMILNDVIMLPIGIIFFTLVSIISCLYFFIVSAKREGLMLIQSMTCVVWQVSITRGEDSAFEFWLRQTIGVSVTYLFQYLTFWAGWACLLCGYFLPCICLWLAMGGIPRILDRFGLAVNGGNKMGMLIHGSYTLNMLLSRLH